MQTLEEEKSILETLFTDKDLPKQEAKDEGIFLIPKWDELASTYPQAVQKVLDLLARTHSFYNWRDGDIDEKHLKETERKVECRAKLALYEDSRFLVLKAQLGKKYQGKSVEQARDSFEKDEFGLGAFEVACILLTHPEILQRYDDLWIDCAGDEYSPDADGSFDDAPCFYFRDGKVKFGALKVDDAYGHYGSASGFLPQSNLAA